MLRPAVRSSVWRIRGYICPTCRITPVVPPAHRVRVYTHDALTSRLDSDAAPHASLNGSPAEPKEGARANVGTAESNSESPIGSTATQAPQSVSRLVSYYLCLNVQSSTCQTLQQFPAAACLFFSFFFFFFPSGVFGQLIVWLALAPRPYSPA